MEPLTPSHPRICGYIYRFGRPTGLTAPARSLSDVTKMCPVSQGSKLYRTAIGFPRRLRRNDGRCRRARKRRSEPERQQICLVLRSSPSASEEDRCDHRVGRCNWCCRWRALLLPPDRPSPRGVEILGVKGSAPDRGWIFTTRFATLKSMDWRAHPEVNPLDRLTLIDSWREALMKQFLTPVPSAEVVQWNKRQAAGQQRCRRPRRRAPRQFGNLRRIRPPEVWSQIRIQK